MAKRFTFTTKWDDDWYLKLSPKMKLAWNYICDNCDGVGLMKLSFGLMSFRIGDEINADEFRAAFEGRITWLSDDSIWIHGFIPAQYKKLSPKNKAHINMANKVLSATEGVQLCGKAMLVLDPLLTLIRESTDPQETVDSPSAEGHRIQDTGYRIQESIQDRECEGKDSISPRLQPKQIRDGLEAAYRQYPRKQGKSPGMRTLAGKIKTQQDLDDLAAAIARYRDVCKRKGLSGEFVLLWSTFANQWRDWLDPETGQSEDFSGPNEKMSFTEYLEAKERAEKSGGAE